jgi:hypothetical protein
VTQEIGQAMGRVFQGWSQWAQGDPEAAGVTALSTVATLGVGGLAAWWRARRNRERESKGHIKLSHEFPEGTSMTLRFNGDEEPKTA